MEKDHTNITFYNEIAPSYDSILNDDGSNEVVRRRVKEAFTAAVKKGHVLDFGGGTGRDLEWLVGNGYRVIFCEPSHGMRKKAIDQYKNKAAGASILFLDNNQVDFTDWLNNLPFSMKTEGVLADFAVLNCIGDIDLLFKTMAQALNPGGRFMALMLQHGYKKTLRWKVREFARNLFSRKALVIKVKYKTHLQTVYVYSPKQIKKASTRYFEMHSSENLFEFTLFHFIKK